VKRWRIAIAGVLALVTVSVFGVGYSSGQPAWLFHWRDFRTGNEIVSRVEAFRTSHRRLPDTLHEIGIDDPDPRVFYRKASDAEFVVWFGTLLGESETYNSRTKQWD
jgi:hypothetical protein